MNMLTRRSLMVAGLAATVAATGVPARAEMSQINIAMQYGISYLGLMVMENDKLLEKNAKAAGLGDITVHWSKLAGGAAMNDALLSGTLQIASGGTGPFLVLWAKLKGTQYEVKAISAKSSSIGYLDTRNPNVKSIKDFTSKDKIGLAAVGVASVAVALQLAAEQAFGEGHHNQLDPITVTMAPPDALAAVLSGGEVNSNFTFPPYHQRLLADPRVHNVTDTDKIFGKGTTLDLIYTTTKFRKENPKLYGAFVKSYKQAIESIYKDKKRAAEIFLKVSRFAGTLDQIMDQLNDPSLKYTAVPRNNMKFAEFMYKTGKIKRKPDSWKDMFFPEIHNLPGS